MPDYNIYIHSATNLGGQDNPTKAWSQQNLQQTEAWNNDYSGYQQTYNSNTELPDYLKNRGIDALKKAIPAVAIAIAVYKIANKIVSTIEPFITRESGDYRFQTGYSNFKVGMGMIFNPSGTALNALTYFQENRIFNRGQEQQRLLLGDSFINSYSRKV